MLMDQADAVAVTAVVKRPDKAVIECEADCPAWSAYLNEQAACRKLIEDQFRPIKTAAYDRHKAICAKEKAKLEPFLQGESQAKHVLTLWVLAENERRAEAQRQAEEKARQDAIADALANGQKRLAQQINTGAVPVATPEAPLPPVKVAGASVKMVKKGRVVDMLAFVKMVAAGRVPVTTLDVNEVALNKWAQATDGTVPVAGLAIDEVASTRRTGRL